MKITFSIKIPIIICGFLIYCNKFEPMIPKSNEILDGEIEGLSYAEKQNFHNGDEAFSDVFTANEGLGPIFVTNSCVSCHIGDGKGHPFTSFLRFGQIDTTGNNFLHLGGPQLQNHALPGYKHEVLPAGASFSKFIAPIVTGLGFLQYVTDADIIAMEDPYDYNGDGISGIAHWKKINDFVIPNNLSISINGNYIHRFGRKANAFDLLDQTVGAYNQDMGITSSFNPNDVYSNLTIDPEVSDKTIRDVVFYLSTLKAPIQRNKDNQEVINGKKIFNQINCSACHKPKLKTGYSPISVLSYKEFEPYTDLLLHDMGPLLDDNYTEGNAKTSEWRTTPLWGLGLSPISQGRKYFLLHDGRAQSIEEAINYHGGEAENSKNSYNNLSEIQKKELIKFLESL